MRTKQVNPIAKQKILEAAQQLMLQKGFSATSLDGICRAAGLTKGSFFHYFKNKDQLGKAMLERFCSSSQRMLEGCCCPNSGDKDPLKRIYNYIDSLIDISKSKDALNGCLLGVFTTELSDSHPHIRSVCDEGFNAWASILRKDIKEAKEKYIPKKEIDVDGLAQHMIAVFEGSQIMARAKKNRRVIGQNMVHLKQYLKFIFGR